MTALADTLARRIRLAGPITVAEFMAEALGNPRHGYYRTRDPLGRAGDFITAPEISQIFGELVGAWLGDLWQRMGRPRPVRLVELGPGRGTLMADALRALRGVPELHAALDLHLVETSAVLREEQARQLAPAQPRWHDHLGTVPPGPMLLVANEFFDALPVRQFIKTGARWRERRVGLDAEGALCFTADGGAAAALVPARFAEAPEGSLFEVSPAARALCARLAARLAGDGGAALVIDYGHAETALGETLQAVRGHRFAPVLADPGEADLTAHVDFAALAETAGGAGARVWGPVPQGAFLRALGAEIRRDALLAAAPPAQRDVIAQGCRRLLDPAEMGTLFKAMAITHPDAPPPAGFESARP